MKMEQFTRFSDEERRMLDDLVSERQVSHAPREDIIREGTHSPDCHVILSGLACRYTILPNGSRQIMAFLVPGDLCDAEIFILDEMDHNVSALVQTTTALISGDMMRKLLHMGRVAEALWWGTMTDLGVLRERIVDHGRRDARTRIAHLLYELLVRYRVVGAAVNDTFDFPITQTDFADASGMTAVHANRILQGLRDEGLITLRNKTLIVLDPVRLKELAGFNARYLHLQRAHDGRDGVADRAGDRV